MLGLEHQLHANFHVRFLRHILQALPGIGRDVTLVVFGSLLER